MNFYWSAVIGVFLGFAFGVGCALAVMYSIYNGGYRKAVEESLLADKPERFTRACAESEAGRLRIQLSRARRAAP